MVIPLDKQLHFFSGGWIAALVLALTRDWLAALAVTVAAGVLKEVYDGTDPARHTRDAWDAMATSLGGAVMAVAMVTCLLLGQRFYA